MRRQGPSRTARNLLVAALVTACLCCTPLGDPTIGQEGFQDDFERKKLGELWHNTGGPYSIRNGKLFVRGARNRPLWLRRVLPRDVRVEVNVRSDSPEGDIKIELFGDGVSKAKKASYLASSYVIIFGGWNNSLNVLARMNEHGDDRVVGPAYKVEQGRTYRMKVERRGNVITAWVDDRQLVRMVDPNPLAGPGHDHFAFNNWSSELWFDNLRISPL